MEHDVRCDCVVAPVEDGWRETRGPVCEARDRAEWRKFMERLDAGIDQLTHELYESQSATPPPRPS